MSFSPSFTTSQAAGFPAVITFTDDSIGGDVNITVRRVYIQTSSGSFLVPAGTGTQYSVWLLVNSSIALDVLDKDYAARIVVQWLDVSGNILYSATQILGFTLYNEAQDYALTQAASGNTLLLSDNNYLSEKSKLRDFIDSGNQAIIFAADIFAAQQCYNAATQLRLNSQYVFNINS